MEMPTHIVAVGGLVVNDSGKVLLVKSERRGWEFPGGQVEIGESLPQALIREIQEESGVTAEVLSLAGIYSNTKQRSGYNGVITIPTIVNVDFRCRYLSGELALSSETIDCGWFSADEARQMVTYLVYGLRLRNLLAEDGVIHCCAFCRDGAVPEGYRLTEEYKL